MDEIGRVAGQSQPDLVIGQTREIIPVIARGAVIIDAGFIACPADRLAESHGTVRQRGDIKISRARIVGIHLFPVKYHRQSNRVVFQMLQHPVCLLNGFGDTDRLGEEIDAQLHPASLCPSIVALEGRILKQPALGITPPADPQITEVILFRSDLLPVNLTLVLGDVNPLTQRVGSAEVNRFLVYKLKVFTGKCVCLNTLQRRIPDPVIPVIQIDLAFVRVHGRPRCKDGTGREQKSRKQYPDCQKHLFHGFILSQIPGQSKHRFCPAIKKFFKNRKIVVDKRHLICYYNRAGKTLV